MARTEPPHPYVESSEYLVIYNYDAHFVEALDLYYDNVSAVFKKHGYVGDYQPEEYFDQNLMVELLIDKLRDEHGHEEIVMDTLFDDFKSDIADDIVDELSNFLNMELYPYGLRAIIKELPRECFLIDVTFDKDSDGTYYSFDCGDS